MPLSDFVLSVDVPQAARDDCYHLKQVVYRTLKPLGVQLEPRQFIYCLDPVSDKIIVRSDDQRIQAISSEIRAVPSSQNGMTFDFCLRASPMMESPRGKCLSDPDRWMAKHLPKMGAEMACCFNRLEMRWCGREREKSGFYLPDVIWVGKLEVTDETNLNSVLQHGIGRHKGFGYGMLQLFN